MNDLRDIESVIEAVLFASGDSVPLEKLADIVGQDKKTTESILSNMQMKFKSSARGIMIRHLGAYYSFAQARNMKICGGSRHQPQKAGAVPGGI